MKLTRISFFALLAMLLAPGSVSAKTYYHYKYKGEYYGYDESGKSTKNRDKVIAARDKDVAKYQSEHAAWEKQKQAYADYQTALKNYQTALNDYNARKAEYDRKLNEWENATGGSGVGTLLDLNTGVAGDPDRKILVQLTEPAKVPDFSDISAYRKYCQEYVCTNQVKGGSLYCPNKYKDDTGVHQISFTFTDTNRVEYWSSGLSTSKIGFTWYARDQLLFKADLGSVVNITRTVKEQRITGGYAGAAVYPFTDKIDGISETCEKSCVVLIGTYNYPIELNGPVYVDGDVIIRGFVKGQGSIYSGRNIHIIGDITYLNPPSWPHSMEDLKKPENTPKKVRSANSGKDLMLLAARGNIVVGDYTSLAWTNATQMSYLDLKKSGLALKTVTKFESDIGYNDGYPADKNYVSDDGGKTMVEYTTVDGENMEGLLEGSGAGLFGIAWRCYYKKTVTPGYAFRNRRYFESSLGDMAIHQLKQTSIDVNAKPTWRTSSTLWRRVFAAIGWYEDNPTVADNTDMGDVTEIDAILYANHGIFGVAGGSVNRKFHLNGAMICRDEGLLTSFAGRFKDYPEARAWINWDMRIKSDLEGSAHIGAPEEESVSKDIGIKRITWRYRK